MLSAKEVASVVHGLGAGTLVSEKIASVRGSVASQRLVSAGANSLYSVIVKEASDASKPNHFTVVGCVTKLAQDLGKSPAPELLQKVAAVVALDDALHMSLDSADTEPRRQKLAALQSFGREFFVELLRGIL